MASSRAESAASTAFYDEDGFPALLPGNQLNLAQVPGPSAVEPQQVPEPFAVGVGLQKDQATKPVLPRSRARKAAVGPPQITPRKSAARHPGGTPVKTTCKNLDTQLSNPKLSLTENRAELCCFVEGVRIFVWGSTAKQYGDKLQVHARLLREFILGNPGTTKQAVLEYRDALQAQK